ncbi:MAG: hypothetical protein GY798_11950 [Hyphomicrobiales bacterium]|nr:hypothetical protein [Hyphomicrobiales bacterium]
MRRFSMTICVSETERAEKSKLYEVAADRVIPSGLPKHSRLLRMSSSTRQDAAPKKVLYAPTWRDWLQHQPSDLAVDAFFAGFERLLAVRPNADEHGERYHITFLLHKNVSNSLQPHLDRFDGIPGVSIAFPDEDISSIVAESDYLISDYSAIIWDFIIQKKRVARFLHDQMIYDYITGEFDFVGDTLNEITFTDEVAVWQEVFSPDNSGKIESLAGEYLGYSDENSCDRLMQAVDQAISDRRRGIFIDA